MSRQLRIGIQYFEQGEDLQAMDRFMDVLTRGDPAERSMANEYINLLTHRMNTSEKGPPPQRPAALKPVRTIVEPVKGNGAVARPTVERSAAPPRAAKDDMPAGNKTLMRKEIKAKLRASLEEGLERLKRIEGVRLLMMSNGEPQAIAIASAALFQPGIAFQKDAGSILDALTKVVFGLGGAQVMILPEGTAVSDAKVLDMRRTMGISAHLFSAGVAPPRVRVNLLNTQVDIPKPLLEFKGIVILFVYNQPLRLVVDSALGEEAGPPISLGLYPATIRPEQGEGAVIEFSVQDPPAGLVSWKFQLLEPRQGGLSNLAPLQEVVGGSPVFHQIYWNGRRNYFGALLASGRYEAVLTATDNKNRQRTLHRWIQVLGSESATKAEAATKPAATNTSRMAAPWATKAPLSVYKVSPGAPSADLVADKSAKKALIKDKSKKAAAHAARRLAKRRKSAKKATSVAPPQEPAQQPAETAAAPPQASSSEKTSKPSSGGFDLPFNPGTHQLTPEGEKRLAQVADTVAYYPMDNLKIQGFAQSSESNAAQLADSRAKMVVSLLINKYQIDPKKIQVGSTVTDTPSFRVQVSFVRE